MKKKELEIVLSKLDLLENPKEELEQYPTPSGVAAEILNMASLSGDIEGKVVSDFGCGNGIFCIGAKILGAKDCIGVDIDSDALDVAKRNSDGLGLEIKFLESDIVDFNGSCDTVIQNSPFGMRGEKNSDRVFLEKALESGKKIYSIHRGGYEGQKSNKTRDFLTNFIEEKRGKILLIKEFKFDVPYMFKFHKKPKVSYNVDLFVIEKV